MLILILFVKIFNVVYSTETCTLQSVGAYECIQKCTTTLTNTIYTTSTSTVYTTVTTTLTSTNTATSTVYITDTVYTTVTHIVYTTVTSTSTVTSTVYSTTVTSTQTYTSTVTDTTTSTIINTATNTQYTTTTATTTSTITNYTTITTTLEYSSIIYLQGILNINSVNQTFYRSISFPIQPGSTIFYLNITNYGNATINNITLSFSVIGNSVILSYNKLPVTTLNNITISSSLPPNNSLIIPFNMLVVSPGLTDVDIGVYVNGQYIGYGNYQFNVEQGSFSSNSSPGLVVSENINYILLSLAGILGLLLLI